RTAMRAVGAGWALRGRAGRVFVVENVVEAAGRGYVLARLDDSLTDFELTDTSRLGGCAVERWLEAPRALDPSGRLRNDLFAFCLRDAADRRHFAIGAHVVLLVEAVP